MQRRDVLRKWSIVVATSTSLGVAGCSSTDGGSEDESGGSDDDDADGESSGSDSSDGEEESGDSSSDADTATAEPTDTPTETETPTPEQTGNPAEGDPEFCGTLNEEGYSRYEPGESPFVATFELPTDTSGSATYSGIRELTLQWYLDDEGFSTFVSQATEGESEQTDSMLGERDGLSVETEISFNGETVPVVRGEPSADDPAEENTSHTYPYYFVGLPHDVGGETRYFRFVCRENQQYQDPRDPPVCVATWEMMARRIVESVEPNPETTVAE